MFAEDAIHCRYDLRADGIHHFTVAQATRQAMQQFLTQLSVVYNAATPHEVVRVLVDVRPAGLPPMINATRLGREFRQSVPNMPAVRVAYVYHESTMMKLAQAFLELVRLKSVTRRLFQDDEEAAVAWLLESPGEWSIAR